MEKMSKTAKNLDIMAKTVAVICVIFGCLFVVTSVAMLFISKEYFSNVPTTITLGPACFELSPDCAPESVFVKSRFIIGLLSVAVLVFFVAYSLKIARKALKPMAEQNPFDESVSVNIKKLGFATLTFGIIFPIVRIAVETYIMCIYDFKELFINGKIVGMEVNFDFDLTFIIIAGVLFMLSYVFKYGAELQKQSDETL